MCDANGTQSVSSDASKSRAAPCLNIVIHTLYDIAPISSSEEYRDHGGFSLSGTEQRKTTKSNADLTPYSVMRPGTPTGPDTDSGTRPNTAAKPDTEARPGTEVRLDTAKVLDTNADARPETDTGNNVSRNEAREGNKNTDSTSSMPTTANEVSVDVIPHEEGLVEKEQLVEVQEAHRAASPAPTSLTNNNGYNLEEIHTSNKRKLRSVTRAERGPSEKNCGEALGKNTDTTAPDFPHKRRKNPSRGRSKVGNRIGSLSNIAETFADVILSNDLESILGCSQSLSIIPRQQGLRTIESIGHQKFLEGLLMRRHEVQSSQFGEKMYRLRHKIALAHFVDDYEIAQANSQLFLQWTEHDACNLIPSALRSTSGRRSTSLVKDRVILICFPEIYKNPTGGLESCANLYADSEAITAQAEAKMLEAREKAARKIQDWLRLGTACSRLIREFGYGVLRLAPSVISDEDLRTMPKADLTKFVNDLKTQRPTFEVPLARANASMAQHLSWPRSDLGNAMSGMVILSEPQTPNTGHATCSNSFTATSVAHTIPMEQNLSRRPVPIELSTSSDVTQMTKGARTSNHEQSSAETSLNLPDVDTRNDTAGTIRTTEIITSDATSGNLGPMSAPHYFTDLFYSLVSPSRISGCER